MEVKDYYKTNSTIKEFVYFEESGDDVFDVTLPEDSDLERVDLNLNFVIEEVTISDENVGELIEELRVLGSDISQKVTDRVHQMYLKALRDRVRAAEQAEINANEKIKALEHELAEKLDSIVYLQDRVNDLEENEELYQSAIRQRSEDVEYWKKMYSLEAERNEVLNDSVNFLIDLKHIKDSVWSSAIAFVKSLRSD